MMTVADLTSRVGDMRASGYSPTKIIMARKHWTRMFAPAEPEGEQAGSLHVQEHHFMDIPLELADDELAVRFQIRHLL